MAGSRLHRGKGHQGGGPRLFDPAGCLIRPNATRRLLELARQPPKPLSAMQLREDEDDETMRQLVEWGEVLARDFKLTYRVIRPEDARVTDWYGICYEDGEIRILLRRSPSGPQFDRPFLIDTLCHELAHLRYLDHSARWERLYRRILRRAEDLDILQPGSTGDGPRQLQLFEGACATTIRCGRRGGRR